MKKVPLLEIKVVLPGSGEVTVGMVGIPDDADFLNELGIAFGEIGAYMRTGKMPDCAIDMDDLLRTTGANRN